MKIFLIFCLGALAAVAQPGAPSIWGKVVKTKKELHGHEYFVTFKENDKSYAYPLSKESKVGEKKLEEMVGQYAKIYGKAEFEKADVGEAGFIMAFQVRAIKPLAFKDLNENMPDFADRLVVKRYVEGGTFQSETYTKSIDDKTANTAIMVGGAALAADVLANILKGSN